MFPNTEFDQHKLTSFLITPATYMSAQRQAATGRVRLTPISIVGSTVPLPDRENVY